MTGIKTSKYGKYFVVGSVPLDDIESANCHIKQQMAKRVYGTRYRLEASVVMHLMDLVPFTAQRSNAK